MDTSSNSSIEKCCCEKSDHSPESDTSIAEPATQKKSKISFSSLGFNLRRGKSLQLTCKRNKKSAQTPNNSPSTSNGNVKKSPKWGLKFNCTRNKESTKNKEPKVALNTDNQNCCQCTCSKKAEPPNTAIVDETASSSQLQDEGTNSMPQDEEVAAATATVAPTATAAPTSPAAAPTSPAVATTSPTAAPITAILSPTVTVSVSVVVDEPCSSNCVAERGSDLPDVECSSAGIYGTSVPGHIIINGPLFDMTWIESVHEDCDETARLARAREIEQGVEPPPNFRQPRRLQLLCSDVESESGQAPRRLQLFCPPDLSVDSLRALFQNHVTVKTCPLENITGCHTQVDFIHCLVPDLYNITNCSFYWGKMDRYEAERLLDGKPEGTFLLRDSAQEEFLFSVSFRKYGRSLHARIEQWNHKFSFDAHDPGVYTSDTVCGLIEHYKDPSSCMFFEPMLTWPLHRNFTFSLQHLCRSVIVNRLTYDDINHLQLPKTLKTYMKEYHYRQKVRVARFDDDVQYFELRNVPP